ncbi:MAG: sporulation protein YqfD [Cellulosilyticaceae bacterium]
MLLSIWYYLRGYVIVEVSGYTLDKFIRLVVSNHIFLWKVVERDGKLYMHTTIDGFKRMKPYAHKSRCRMKILKKKGLPFLSFRYRKRWLFGIGSLLFAIGLYTLCSFVWLVDVTGNDRLQTTDVIQVLSKEGYGVGKLKGSLDLRQAEKVLMNAYPEIVWVGIQFEGTKMVVQVSESVLKPPTKEKGAPCDLVAKRDTLITYIVADTGMPKVKVGDTVKKGEVLISGSIPLQDEQSSLYFTESRGVVKGKTGYSLKATMPLTKIHKVYENEVATSYRIKLFETVIPIYTSKKAYTTYDTLVTANQLRLTDMFPLPFYFEKVQKVPYKATYKEVTEEEAKDQLLGALYDELRSMLGKDAVILKQEMLYTEEDGQMLAELNVIVEESVSIRQPLTNENTMLPESGETEGVGE